MTRAARGRRRGTRRCRSCCCAFTTIPTTGRYTLAITRLLQLARRSHRADRRRHRRARAAAREAAVMRFGLPAASANAAQTDWLIGGLVGGLGRRAGAGVRADAASTSSAIATTARSTAASSPRRPSVSRSPGPPPRCWCSSACSSGAPYLYVRLYQPPPERAEDLRRRQAVDVEDRASRRPARDQRAARAGRQPVELVHDLARTSSTTSSSRPSG